MSTLPDDLRWYHSGQGHSWSLEELGRSSNDTDPVPNRQDATNELIIVFDPVIEPARIGEQSEQGERSTEI